MNSYWLKGKTPLEMQKSSIFIPKTYLVSVEGHTSLKRMEWGLSGVPRIKLGRHSHNKVSSHIVWASKSDWDNELPLSFYSASILCHYLVGIFEWLNTYTLTLWWGQQTQGDKGSYKVNISCDCRVFKMLMNFNSPMSRGSKRRRRSRFRRRSNGQPKGVKSEKWPLPLFRIHTFGLTIWPHPTFQISSWLFFLHSHDWVY